MNKIQKVFNYEDKQGKEQEVLLGDIDSTIELLKEFKNEKVRRIKAEKTVDILEHVNYTYNPLEIAKELGFESHIELNKDLEDKNIQFELDGEWVLCGEYAHRGYVLFEQVILDDEEKVFYTRRFTELGREFLLDLYKQDKSND